MNYLEIKEAFIKARRQADLADLVARLRGRDNDLLNYDEVRRALRGAPSSSPELQLVPVTAIVGTVGRQADFTRAFLPRNDGSQERWATVYQRMLDPGGLPPIQLFRIGDAYFVQDGHHRVSIARQLGMTDIDAYVTEVQAQTALSAAASLADVYLQSARLEFLNETGLDTLRPEHGINATIPDNYAALRRHIASHHHAMQVRCICQVSFEEAVADWYDHVYTPVIAAIRAQDLLRDFSGRTETDLYLLASGYRAFEAAGVDWGETADFKDARPQTKAPRLPEADILPGAWRRERLWGGRLGAAPDDFRLFTTILVPVTGQPGGWAALQTALDLAQQERGRVLGLYVLRKESREGRTRAVTVKAEFEQRCAAAAIPGALTVETGEVASHICARSAWADLTIIKMAYPPPAHPLARLSSGFRTLIRDADSPLLVLPGGEGPLWRHALVAYDGERHSEPALLVAAYLARRWGTKLTVFTVGSQDAAAATILERARQSLVRHSADAELHQRSGPVAETIVDTTQRLGCDLIITGGYSRPKPLEMALGSAVDQILRASWLPTLICP